jgi:hypothetical protein
MKAFVNLTELFLNATLTTWSEMQQVTYFMPLLVTVELGYNDIVFLPDLSASGVSTASSKIRSLNLDSNLLKDWPPTCAAVNSYQKWVSLGYVHIFLTTVYRPSHSKSRSSCPDRKSDRQHLCTTAK